MFIFRKRDSKCMFLSECVVYDVDIEAKCMWASGVMKGERRGNSQVQLASAQQTEPIVAPAYFNVSYLLEISAHGKAKICSVEVKADIYDDHEFTMRVDGILQLIEMPSYAHRWK